MSEIESGHMVHVAHIAAVLLAAKRGLVCV
jgi:hypothetical protein